MSTTIVRPSPEAAAALDDARRAHDRLTAVASEGAGIAESMRRQRTENHLVDLVECAVNAAAAASPGDG